VLIKSSLLKVCKEKTGWVCILWEPTSGFICSPVWNPFRY